MFNNNIGFFPRELAIPEATTPSRSSGGEDAPCYLPTTDSAEGEELAVSDAEVNEYVRRIQAGAALDDSGHGSDGHSSNGSADVSDAAVDRVLREVGVEAGAEEVAPAEEERGGEGSTGSASEFDPRRQSVVRVLREAAHADSEAGREGGGSRHATNWAKTPAQWWPHGFTPAKKYPDEDESCRSWRDHSHHYLIVSNAGKPVYSRYGDEHKLAAFGGIIQALVSYAASPAAGSDNIQAIRAGLHQIVFLTAGPLYLLAVCKTGTPTIVLRHHLALLHKGLFMLLTSGVETNFIRNPNLDLQPLLHGTEAFFSALTHSFTWDPSTYVSSFRCLRLPSWLRTTVSGALKAAVAVAPSTVVQFALVFSGFQVITIAQQKRQPMSSTELCLLLNLVNSSDSFRRVPESFAPVCLLTLCPSAFHYAHISYVTPEICVTLISSNPHSFTDLKAIREDLYTTLASSGALVELSAAARQPQLSLKELLPHLDPLYTASGTVGAPPAATRPHAPAGVSFSAGQQAYATLGAFQELPTPEPVQMGPGMGCDIIPMGADVSAGAPASAGPDDQEGPLGRISQRWRGDLVGETPSDGGGESGIQVLGQEDRGQGDESSSGGLPRGRENGQADGAPNTGGGVPKGSPLWGPSGLWHFMFKSIQLGQFVSSEFSPLLQTKESQKVVLRAYQQMYASMHADGLDPSIPATIKTQSRRTSEMLLLGWSTSEFEFFAAFDAFASKKGAVAVCNRICKLLQSLESEVFLLGPVVI